MKNKITGQALGLLIATIVLIFAFGCQTVKPTTPEIVYVETYKKHDKLQKPEEPEWTLEEVMESAAWQEWLEAMSVDLGRCLDWGAAIEHVIDAWNEANEETGESAPETR